jgi:hypothetical protein
MLNPLYMTNNLFWLHPNGHEIPLPCTHITTQRLNGNLTIPCSHLDWQNGKWTKMTPPDSPLEVNVLIPQPREQNDNIPLNNIVIPMLEHPGGHPGITVPCIHPMPLKRRVEGLWIDFYTDNSFIQEETIKAVAQLLYLGANLASPGRPLNVFYRGYLADYPSNSDNPFWNHYDPFTNSIQVLDDGRTQNEIRDSLHHELGHATLGHRIVQPPTPGGTHNLNTVSQPTLAMSEGWAHFVALASRFRATDVPNQTSAMAYNGQNWETRVASVPLSPNIEYNVACTLWDCYDVAQRTISRLPEELAALPFSDLYRVYNPTLSTIPFGPLIPNIDDYLDRLIANNPGQRDALLHIRDINCGFARRVTLLASNQNYLGIMGEGVFAVTPSVGTTQRFLLEKEQSTPFAHGDIVHLKAFHGKYLVAELDHNPVVLNANRDLPNQWETFVLERISGVGLLNSGDIVALKQLDSGYYVSIDPVFGSQVKVKSTSSGTSERFTITLNV